MAAGRLQLVFVVFDVSPLLSDCSFVHIIMSLDRPYRPEALSDAFV